MKLRKIVLFFAMLIGWSVASLAQTKIVSGKVTGANDQPLSGATIKVEGSQSAATSTNEKGEFKISAKEGNTLQISSVGFKSLTVKVGSATIYNVNLEVFVNVMDEVVVTAGGIKSKRRELGNAAPMKAMVARERFVTRCVRPRTRCGTTIPTKPMSPEADTAVAVARVAAATAIILKRFGSIPSENDSSSLRSKPSSFFEIVMSTKIEEIM